MNQHKKFVILSAARSGSSLLTEACNRLDGVICHGEIFHEQADKHVLAAYRQARDMAVFAGDPTGFARSVLEFAPDNTLAVGFKMWREQQPDVCRAMLEDEDVYKVILERKNKLAHFSSAQLARKSGVWNAAPHRKTDFLADFKATFDQHAFEHYLANDADRFAFYRQCARGPVIDISYEDVAQHGPAQVAALLEIPFDAANYAHQKKRLHSDDILSRFEPDSATQAERFICDLGFAEWRHERL